MMQIYVEYRDLAGRTTFYFAEVRSIGIGSPLDRPEELEIEIVPESGSSNTIRVDRVDCISGYGKTVPEYRMIDHLKKLIEPPAQEGRELEESGA